MWENDFDYCCRFGLCVMFLHLQSWRLHHRLSYLVRRGLSWERRGDRWGLDIFLPFCANTRRGCLEPVLVHPTCSLDSRGLSGDVSQLQLGVRAHVRPIFSVFSAPFSALKNTNEWHFSKRVENSKTNLSIVHLRPSEDAPSPQCPWDSKL